MLLVSSTYQDELLEIEDSCPHCLDRIRLTIEGRRLQSAEPMSVYAFYGGG
jgi:hypothetical protein